MGAFDDIRRKLDSSSAAAGATSGRSSYVAKRRGLKPKPAKPVAKPKPPTKRKTKVTPKSKRFKPKFQ